MVVYKIIYRTNVKSLHASMLRNCFKGDNTVAIRILSFRYRNEKKKHLLCFFLGPKGVLFYCLAKITIIFSLFTLT